MTSSNAPKWSGFRTTSTLCISVCSGLGGAPLARPASGPNSRPLEPTKVVRIPAPIEYLPTYVGLKTKPIRPSGRMDLNPYRVWLPPHLFPNQPRGNPLTARADEAAPPPAEIQGSQNPCAVTS